MEQVRDPLEGFPMTAQEGSRALPRRRDIWGHSQVEASVGM